MLVIRDLAGKPALAPTHENRHSGKQQQELRQPRFILAMSYCGYLITPVFLIVIMTRWATGDGYPPGIVVNGNPLVAVCQRA
ncbi:MAG: hypothetical protein ACLR9W_04490 [Enterobacter hormaechei]